jgi:DNA-binding response OmpR family regulator
MFRLLVIDDEEPILEIIKFIFINEGYDVKTISNPTKAFNTIDSFSPDVILLDIKMPQMDGRDLCRQIKQKYGIPVILVSANNNLDSTFQIYNADGFLAKPFDMDILINKVASLLPLNTASSS